MNSNDAELPQKLRADQGYASTFKTRVANLLAPPTYKILLVSIDSWCTFYRAVHAYYISVLDEYPSHIQKKMRSLNISSTFALEDGKLIDDMKVYRIYTKLDRFEAFKAMMQTIIRDNSQNYAMVSCHNVVQYSNNLLSEPIVMSDLSFE